MEYLFESGMNRYRVWKTNWFNDQFEILTPDQFKRLQELVNEFPTLVGPLVENDD